MVSEQVCNYLMGGFLTIVWIWKAFLYTLAIGTLLYLIRYWLDLKYNKRIKFKDKKEVLKLIKELKKQLD